MSNIVGTATIKIIPNTAGFSAALNGQLKSVSANAQKSVGGALGALDQARGSLSSFGDSLSRTGQRAILAGGAMTYGLTRPLIGLASTMVGTAAEFERSLNTIAAVGNLDLGSADLDRIGTKARDLAKTFPQDANAIAKGMLDLARAGLDTADKIDAVIEPILQLSTIEDIDLTKASELLVNVFTGFGGSFSNVGDGFTTIFGEARQTTSDMTAEFTRMGDILATVSAATTTDITDLGNAFRYAGPVAAAAGLSFAESAAALGVLAQAGFNATVGGTALRGIITRLAIPTKLSQEIFDKFGLSVEEAFAPDTIGATSEQAEELNKQLRDMGLSAAETSDVMGTKGVAGVEEFKTQLSSMGLETLDIFKDDGTMRPLQETVDRFVASGARVGDVMKLFGQRSGPAFLALMKQAGAFRELTAESQAAEGAMGEMSDKIEQSAAVKFILFKNAIVDLAISVGESGLLEFFSNLAIGATEFVQGLSDTNPQIVKFVFVLGGLVAILGPATLIFGLFGEAAGKLVESFAFMLGPVGAVVLVVGLLAAAFGFMYSQSESLRAAVAVLSDSFSAVLGPVMEVGRILLGAFAGGVGELGKTLGDALAPKIIEVAQVINNWVSNNGLVEFLTGVNEKILATAEFVYNLVQAVQDLGIMEAMGDAIQRVWGDAVEFFGHFKSVVDNLIPAILEIGTAVGTGAAVAIRILWQAGAALLSVFEKFLDIAGPIISFLGDNLTLVLTLVIAKMLLTRNAFLQTATGLAAFGGAVGRVSTFVTDRVVGIGLSAINMGERIQAGTAKFATATAGIPIIGRMADVMARAGNEALWAGDRVGAAATMMVGAMQRIGEVASTVLQNAQLIMAGFFSGKMAASADSLGGAITALIPSFIAMGVAITAGLGPAGMLLAIGTALATVFGMMTGGARDASTSILDLASTTDSLVSLMQSLNGSISGGDALAAFSMEMEKLNPGNMKDIEVTLGKLGKSSADLGEALLGGADGANAFADSLSKDFGIKQLQGDLNNFTFKKFDDTASGAHLMGTWADVVKSDLIPALESGTETIEVFDSVTGESLGTVHNMEEAAALLAAQFEGTFGGKAIREFGTYLDAARLKQEAMGPATELIQRNQDYINDKAKTWTDRIKDANASLDETKQRMRDLFAPVDDAGQNIADLYRSIRDGKDAFINPNTGQPWLTIPAPDSEEGAKYFNAVKDVKNLWTDTQTIIANGINPALDDTAKRGIFREGLFAERLRLIGNLAAAYQITPEQATALADQIAGALPTDLEVDIRLGLDEDGLAVREAQEEALAKRFNLDVRQVKIFGEFELDPTSAEAHEFAKIIAGIKDIPDEQLNIAIKTIDEMEPGVRDWVRGLITGGKVGTQNIASFIELIPRVAEAGIGGVSGATLAALLQGQDPEAIRQFLDFVPQIAQIGGLSPEDNAKVVQMLIGKSPETVKKFIDVLPSINGDNLPGITPDEKALLTAIVAGRVPLDAQKFIDVFPQMKDIPGLTQEQMYEVARILSGKSPENAQKVIELIKLNPDMWAEIIPLMTQEGPRTAQLILDVMARGDVNALLSAADLAAAARFAVNGGFGANGGMFTSPTSMIIGEAGPEVLIPLSRPNRARELIAQSGLYSKFPPLASSGVSTLGGTPPVLPAGKFQSVTPAAEGYAAAIWATGAASGFSTEAQAALAEQMGFPMDTTPIDAATAKVDGLTAALGRARDMMASMAGNDGPISEGDPRWDWMTMGNGLGPGGLSADQYNGLDPAIRALLDQADNYAEAVDVLDDYGWTGFAPGTSPTLSGVSSGMSLLQGMPASSLSTPDRSAAGNQLSIAVTVEATPGTTKEHAAMVGETVADGINRKLAIKTAVFSS